MIAAALSSHIRAHPPTNLRHGFDLTRDDVFENLATTLGFINCLMLLGLERVNTLLLQIDTAVYHQWDFKNHVMGFPTAPRLILRIKSKGLFFGGVPCDSMGFLSSPTHKRSALFPWGAPYGFVYTGNILCCRFSMMVLISISRGVVWGLENPERTAINHVPPIGLLLQSFLRPLTVKWYLCEKEHFCMSSS